MLKFSTTEIYKAHCKCHSEEAEKEEDAINECYFCIINEFWEKNLFLVSLHKTSCLLLNIFQLL